MCLTVKVIMQQSKKSNRPKNRLNFLDAKCNNFPPFWLTGQIWPGNILDIFYEIYSYYIVYCTTVCQWSFVFVNGMHFHMKYMCIYVCVSRYYLLHQEWRNYIPEDCDAAGMEWCPSGQSNSSLTAVHSYGWRALCG